MKKYFDFIISSSGRKVTTGSVSVLIYGTATPASLFSDAAGTVPIANPVPIDSRGYFEFYAADGRYSLTVNTPDFNPVTLTDIVLDDPASGADIGYTPAGAGAVATTVQAKLRESVSVKDFGAVGDGVADDTAAFSNAFATGKLVYAPAGTYRLNSLNIPSNSRLVGDGGATVIKPLTDDTRCALGADSGSATAFIDNITIRNVRFLGNVATVGFSEQKHLVSFNGVKNMLIESCDFVGFRGDGLYLGSGNVGGQERHNIGVTIRNCLFDGVNADNRNGVSIIDADTVTIEGCLFTNTTKAGMPGSIDCEPDANAFAVIRNVTIRNNRFSGGNESAIALLLQDQSFLTTPHENFLIEGNFIQKPKGLTFNGENVSLSDSTIPYGVLFLRNVVKGSSTPFLIDGARGLTLQENTFEESALPAEFGYVTGNFDCSIVGNTFYRCGQDNTSGTRGLWIRTATRLTIEGNSFVDCGRADGTTGRSIEFVSGASGAHIYLRNNEFSSPTGRTNYVIFALGYTFDNGTCEDLNNKYLFSSNNDFIAPFGRRTAAPTTGTWAQGNVVYNSQPNAQGVLGWICTASGSPGTWQAVSTRLPFRRLLQKNYAVTENFDAATYDIFSINIQSNPALTYNAPTGGTVGQEITIRVRNGSGGVMGTITWDSVFKMSGWTNPANGNSRSVTFVYDGTNWIEISQTVGNVAN